MKKRFCALALLFAVFFAAGITTAAEAPDSADVPASLTEPAKVTSKDEVVYARLSGNGGAESAYIVNHFTLASGGAVTDYGDYSEAVNLTGLEPVTLSGGTVSVPAESGNFYYQGTLSDPAALPWVYTAEYRLDGAVIAPEDLAGKSGKLEIRLTSASNTAGGVFYEHYMQQITVTLGNDKCSNIEAPGAAVAGAGKNRVLAFTVLPKTDADILITADAADFEMPGIDITAMPFSMQIEQPDTAALLGGFTQLSGAAGEISAGVGASEDAASQLADAAAALAALAASDPMLGGALAELSGGLTALRDGLSELHTGTETLAGETAGIPGRVQAELDTLIGAYTGGGFEPVSFASKTNQDIAFVQFVFKTDGIQKPAVKAPETEDPEPSGFWDRLGKLFGR